MEIPTISIGSNRQLLKETPDLWNTDAVPDHLIIGNLMEDFVAYIIKNLVSNPEEVVISSSTLDEEVLRVEIRVADEDVGKVIGRRGNTINALRTIVRTVATRLGQKAQVELIQTERQMQAAEEKREETPEDAESIATPELALS